MTIKSIEVGPPPTPTETFSRGIQGPISFLYPGEVAAPKKIPGLQLWLDANVGATLSTVTRWLDQSGNGDPNRNAVVANGLGALYVASDPEFNNQPMLTFTTGNLQLEGLWNDAPVNQPFTLFIVGRDIAVGHPPWLGDADINQWYMATCALQPALDPPPHFVSSAVTPSPNDVELQSTTIDVGQPVVWCFEFNDPNSSTMRINSQTPEPTIQRGGSGSADTGIPTLGRLAIGWANGTGLGLDTGKIGAIVIYDGSLSDADRASVITYLGSVFGVGVAGTPGAAIANPRHVAGLRLWLDARYGVYANVTRWADQSDAHDPNRDVVCGSPGRPAPIRVPSDSKLNGQASMLFAGVEFFDMVGLWNNAPVEQPYTLIVVGYDSAAGNQNFIGQIDENNWYVSTYNGHYASSIGSTTLSGTSADSVTPKILYFEYNGANSTIRVNQETPQKIGPMDPGALPHLEIGGNTQGQAALLGAIGTALIYRGLLSDGDRIAIQSYLSNRYGPVIGP